MVGGCLCKYIPEGIPQVLGFRSKMMVGSGSFAVNGSFETKFSNPLLLGSSMSGKRSQRPTMTYIYSNSLRKAILVNMIL